MADSKAFLTLGQFSDMFAGGLILSVDETVYNPNGKLPGEWGHYTDPTAKTGWTQTPEVLTVIKDKSIIGEGQLLLERLSDGAGPLHVNTPDVNPSSAGFLQVYNGSSVKVGYEPARYRSGVKIKETQNVYRWIKKSS